MIVACPNCTTRLQLDDAKVPARPFTMRCPKCQQIINAQPPSTSGGALAAGGGDLLPASTRAQRESKPAPAPVFDATVDDEAAPSGARPSTPAPQGGEGELARLLAALLQRGAASELTGATPPPHGRQGRPGWERRRALVCVGAEAEREVAARALAKSRYEVFVAADTSQAIERMREDKMDVVVLDAEFDAAEQGAAFINREMNTMRPAERRRVVFVNLSPTARTADAHAAFLANVNLIVNHSDAAELPHLLERCIRSMNELYRDYNKALNVAEL
ncbi:MAG TPA: zinc-ribbon domain-containing protein [Pyrinomonadaceae bacterium]|nr:zinc-ribbon domain-containing protein [Pyrinomonadaceae bacterium]